MKRLKWLFQAAIRCVKTQYKYLRNGKKMATLEIQNQRRSICEPCEFRDGLKCGECGCPITEKTELKESECPVGKWN